MINNLLEYYRKSDGVTKKKILNTIFAEKLIVINGEVIEPIFTKPIQLILRISGDYGKFQRCVSVRVSLENRTPIYRGELDERSESKKR